MRAERHATLPAGRVVGIDVGGTKTHIRVHEGGSHRDRVVPTTEWRNVDDPLDLSGIPVLMHLLAALGVEPGDPLAVGAHGCDNRAQAIALETAIRRTHETVLVVNDAELIVPAAGHDAGIGVVAGTGSIVVGRTAAGEPVAAGGHGWLLSDPGSAPSIAREAVKAVLDRQDHVGEIGALGRALFAEVGVADVESLADQVTRTAGIHAWAALAPHVFDAADAGSADARAVIDDEARRLAQLTAAVARRGAAGRHVVAVGGVIVNQPRFEERFQAHTRELLPGFSFEVLRTPPVAGAVRLAASLVGTPTL